MSLVLLVWKSLHFLTWMSVSFHRFGKFSAIISSNKFSISFSLFSKILKMQILVCLMLSQGSLKPFSLKKQKQKLSLWSLGWECSWRRAGQPTPVVLPGESPWTEGPGGLQTMGSRRVGHGWVTERSTASSVLQVAAVFKWWPLIFFDKSFR